MDDGVTTRDPAGLFERIPELVDIARASGPVQKAIERGKPGGVYRALRWFAWTGNDAALKAKAHELLKHRRLFLEPLTGAPHLMTLNGVGSKLYGRAEQDRDTTYISTLYIVILFIPVFPLKSYLVADGGQNMYRFIGKVPFSAFHYLWQRALAFAAIAAVAFGSYRAFYASRHGTVYVANGLEHAVEVQVGKERPLTVQALTAVPVELPSGSHDIAVSANGKVVEKGKVDVPRGNDLTWWNVAGAALVYESEVVYSKIQTESGTQSEPSFHCEPGQRTSLDVDYVFTDPPQSLSVSNANQSLTKRRVDMVRMKNACLTYFASNGRFVEAAAVAARVADVEQTADTVAVAVQLLMQSGKSDEALKMATSAVRAHDDSLEFHRTYQTVLDAQNPDAAVAEYRQRLAAAPNSADALYLLARLVHGDEAETLMSKGLSIAPGHAYLLRSRGFVRCRAGKFEDAARDFAAVRAASSALWEDLALLHVHALAGSGQVAAARALVSEILASSSVPQQTKVEAATAGILLARFTPAEDPSHFVPALVQSDGKPHETGRLQARIEGGLDVDANELASVEDEVQKGALQVMLVSQKAPAAALDALAKLPPAVASRLTYAEWGLLFGEAARQEPPHAVLPKLLEAGQLPARSKGEMVAFVREGKPLSLEDAVPDDMLAALYLARSRRPEVDDKGRMALLERVATLDPLHGPVTRARTAWHN